MTAAQVKPPKQKQLGKTKSDLKRRARIAAQAIIAGQDTTSALVTAGYSKGTALTNSTQILNNPVVKQTFNDLLDKAGLSDDALARRISELSRAKEVKFFADKGIVTDQREVEALSIQADMVKFAAKVKGHVVDRHVTESQGNTYIDLSSYDVKVEISNSTKTNDIIEIE